MNTKIRAAYNDVNVSSDVLPYDKFEQICILLENQYKLVDIVDFINGGENGWENNEEHNDWLGNATSGEIASWVNAGLK